MNPWLSTSKMTLGMESQSARILDQVAEWQRGGRGEDQVRERAGCGDQGLAPPAAREVRWVDRRRLGPAEAEAPTGPEEGDRQQDPAERVEMDDRVERQAAEQLRGAITETKRRQCVAEFMDRESDQEHDRDRDRDG